MAGVCRKAPGRACEGVVGANDIIIIFYPSLIYVMRCMIPDRSLLRFPRFIITARSRLSGSPILGLQVALRQEKTITTTITIIRATRKAERQTAYLGRQGRRRDGRKEERCREKQPWRERTRRKEKPTQGNTDKRRCAAAIGSSMAIISR